MYLSFACLRLAESLKIKKSEATVFSSQYKHKRNFFCKEKKCGVFLFREGDCVKFSPALSDKKHTYAIPCKIFIFFRMIMKLSLLTRLIFTLTLRSFHVCLILKYVLLQMSFKRQRI